jgi:hypothetical protein
LQCEFVVADGDGAEVGPEEFAEELVAAEWFGADGDDGLQEFLDSRGVFVGNFNSDAAGAECGHDSAERGAFGLQLELAGF